MHLADPAQVEPVALRLRQKTKTLPFVCRLKDAKGGKWKQNVIEVSNTEESVKAKR